jgi:integrase
MTKLTNAALKGLLKQPGHHGDEGGLSFRVLPGEKGYWVYRYQADGRRREMSLGPYPELGLAEARKKHAELRARVIADKADPLREKSAAKQAQVKARALPTFGRAADDYIATHEDSWRNDKHRWQWRQALTHYCAPIRGLPVDQVDTETVLSVLKPIWTDVPETAARLRGRIERVIDAARARGLIDENRANPTRWRGHLDHLLPKRRRLTRGHHPAMPYADLPAFMAKLKRSPGTAATALMLVILTAARSGEVFGMRWEEVDLDAKIWTVPGERMKMDKEHFVPLSDEAVAILRGQRATRPPRPFVFPGAKPRAPLSNMAFAMVMRRMGAGEYTPHGFRSAFRDWAAEHGVEFEVAEQCLAHAVGNAVTRAYLRSTMIERRRKVMADWAAFLAGEREQAKVIQFKIQRG